MNTELPPEVYEEILTHTVDGFTIIDSEEIIRYVEPTSEQLFGHEPDAVIGDSLLQYIHPDDRDMARKTFRTIDRSESERTIEAVELRLQHSDGSWVWTESRVTDRSTSKIDGYVLTSRNISERKEAAQDLVQMQQLLEKTEQIADVGGWEIDTETREVFWTEHLFDLLGVDYGEEPPLKEALEVYHDDDRPRVANAVEEALEAGESFDVEARFQRQDDEFRWFQIQGVPTVEDDEVVTLRGAVQDITEKKERETRLREIATRLQALFENSPDMIDVLNPDGTILDVNQRFCDEVGYDEEEVIGRPIWEIDQLVSEDDVQTLLSDFSVDERRKFDGRYERRDGSTFPVEVHLLRLEIEGENRFLAISRDITERKKRERQLNQQNKQLEEFASVVSHDLRNPLGLAKGRLELASEECDSEHLASIDTALDRMDRIIDDILWLTREGKDIGEIRSVDLDELLESAWMITADGHDDATLVIEGGDSECLGTVDADPDRLQQLLENLFRNAIEHGGEDVTVTVGELENGIFIEDNGPGIPKEDRNDVFDAGYSTSEDGTGFGLSIVNQVVDAHGWDVRVTEASENGTRFEITDVHKPD
jgi:PAS domain S-box-containing protein